MTEIVITGEATVYAGRADDGWYLSVGGIEVKLSHAEADRLGRALLFEGTDDDEVR